MSILGAIGGLVGSIFGQSQSKKIAEKNLQVQKEIADKNIALQREFATQGVRWKVDDAKAAGIHPLYALGAQTHSFSPVNIGDYAYPTQDFATVGQNLGSAVQAMTTPAEKTNGFQKSVQDLTLQKMGLENQILATQLRIVNQPGRGPGMPAARSMIPGQGNTPQELTTAGGVSIGVNPVNSPAEAAENQYGEIAGEIWGIGNLITDMARDIIKSHPDLGGDIRSIMESSKRYFQAAPRQPRGAKPRYELYRRYK